MKLFAKGDIMLKTVALETPVIGHIDDKSSYGSDGQYVAFAWKSCKKR